MIYVVEQDDDFSEMPDSWPVWRRNMSHNARGLYETLIKPEYHRSAPLPDRLLAKQAALSSRNALHVALKSLKTMHFVGLYEDAEEGVTYINVSAPPPMTELDQQAFDTIGAQRAETYASMGVKFVHLWQQGFEKVLHEPYTLSMKDKHQGVRLAKNEPDWKAVESVIKWYWRYGFDDERMSFAYFCSRFNEFSQRKSTFEGNLE